MPKRKNEPETNIEFIVRMMEFSNYGALAQIFVFDALTKWSDIISKTEPDKVDTPLINGHAWVGVAREIKAKLEARHESLP